MGGTRKGCVLKGNIEFSNMIRIHGGRGERNLLGFQSILESMPSTYREPCILSKALSFNFLELFSRDKVLRKSSVIST